MKTRAAVAFEAKKPLEIVELDLEGPKAGEVLIEIKATGICHTDAYTLDGLDSEGLFPSVLGHEGAGIVREVGAGVTSVKEGQAKEAGVRKNDRIVSVNGEDVSKMCSAQVLDKLRAISKAREPPTIIFETVVRAGQ